LTGEDGNAFAIIGRVMAAMKRKGLRDEATEYMQEAQKCESRGTAGLV